MMGRVGCTFAALLDMTLASETVEEGIEVVMVLLLQIVVLCLGDFSDVRERADVSAGSSFISGTLHDWYVPKI